MSSMSMKLWQENIHYLEFKANQSKQNLDTFGSSLKKLNAKFSYNPAILLLDISLRETEIHASLHRKLFVNIYFSNITYTERRKNQRPING